MEEKCMMIQDYIITVGPNLVCGLGKAWLMH